MDESVDAATIFKHHEALSVTEPERLRVCASGYVSEKLNIVGFRRTAFPGDTSFCMVILNGNVYPGQV